MLWTSKETNLQYKYLYQNHPHLGHNQNPHIQKTYNHNPYSFITPTDQIKIPTGPIKTLTSRYYDYRDFETLLTIFINVLIMIQLTIFRLTSMSTAGPVVCSSWQLTFVTQIIIGITTDFILCIIFTTITGLFINVNILLHFVIKIFASFCQILLKVSTPIYIPQSVSAPSHPPQHPRHPQ